MAARRGTIGVGAGVVLLCVWAILAPLLHAQAAVDVKPIERDPFREADRYEVSLHAGATLWEVANDYLPLTGFDEGDTKAFQVVEESFLRTFPGRKPGLVQPEDVFLLEVPPGTFVTQKISRENGNVIYTSYQGDVLTYYPHNPAVQYRLVRRSAPDRAEVSLTAQSSSAIDLARDIYEVNPPDFIQVRMVRAALNDRTARVIIDLNRKYLDDFRNYRDRAARFESGDNGLQIYTFDPNAADIPFVRVEDAIGDNNDPGSFPREFRLAFHRDGTVKKYVLTESGDALAQLNQPDSAAWRKVLPQFAEWQTGVVEQLQPFTPAVNQAGSLIPGRILVLSFAPKTAAQPTAAAGRPAAGSGSGIVCLGVPLAVVLLSAVSWALGLRTPGLTPGP